MKHILVVEDDSFLNKMLSYNLRADGYEITSVLNARTATNLIQFCLILTCRMGTDMTYVS